MTNYAHFFSQQRLYGFAICLSTGIACTLLVSCTSLNPFVLSFLSLVLFGSWDHYMELQMHNLLVQLLLDKKEFNGLYESRDG